MSTAARPVVPYVVYPTSSVLLQRAHNVMVHRRATHRDDPIVGSPNTGGQESRVGSTWAGPGIQSAQGGAGSSPVANSAEHTAQPSQR